METYQGKINEFVDWASGIDSTTGRVVSGVDENTPISGKSIRELLQTHIKTPFVYYEDRKEGLYRLFSSEEAKNKWLNITENKNATENQLNLAKSLELFNFVRPGDVAISLDGINNNPRFIISGDNSGTDSQTNPAIVQFTVGMKKVTGSVTTNVSDAFDVTYTITDSNKKVYTLVENKDASYCNPAEGDDTRTIKKNVYEYLTEGLNNIDITVKAKGSSASANANFDINVIKFRISSNFTYSGLKSIGNPLSFTVYVLRSVKMSLKYHIKIDGEDARSAVNGNIIEVSDNSDELTPSYSFSIKNDYAANTVSDGNTGGHIKHLLQIYATLNDTYYSNYLFYEFENAASSTTIINNTFVNIAYDTPYNKVHTDGTSVMLSMTQYTPFMLNWGYWSDSPARKSGNVQWALRSGTEGNYKYTPIKTLPANTEQVSSLLTFIPTQSVSRQEEVYLVARINDKDIDEYLIEVAKSQFSIAEKSGYSFKIDAYGKDNSAIDANTWVDSVGNIPATFSFKQFDLQNGWNDNSFTTHGSQNYATFNYYPLEGNVAGSGRTIEFEFKSIKTNKDSDIIMLIGDSSGGRIEVRPQSAGVYAAGQASPLVETNFKSGERIKLAFVFNPDSATLIDEKEAGLVYIINNGILERAAARNGSIRSDFGGITIGGSESGIQLYNMRIYNFAITPAQGLDNYIYDVEDKSAIISRNKILNGNKIDYDLTKDKIDTILIKGTTGEGIVGWVREWGDLNAILKPSTAGKTECIADIERICVTDPSKSFVVKNARVRKHGQSTLNYPLTSLKIWFNKSGKSGVNTQLTLSPQLTAMGLNKNRYIMKDGAIPSNKFVLLANYADSSGVHNGGIERLINDSWYNASFGQNKIHRLRTAPLLFASGEVLTHNNANLGEIGDVVWQEGNGNGERAIYKDKSTDENSRAHTWPEITGELFPYMIRTGADSFACAVFYQNIDDDSPKFLGQYVFMDDKKSDYLYGERSIYSFDDNSDPFVLKTENNIKESEKDVSSNRVWDNSDVLRIEVVLPNYQLTSYMSYDVDTKVETITDENTGEEITVGNGEKVSCDTVKPGTNIFYWEEFFEMIYPDPDDLKEDAGVSRTSPNSKFSRKAKPFLTWLKWITDCAKNYDKQTQWWSAGKYSTKQQAFLATAAQHLDLYKLAAYYIFFLRFGLVDSVERNAQLKTYDGQHWHYEPWDMDIALGNTNQGVLAFVPPMDRSSLIPGTQIYAFSGRSQTTSNTLWDCLEAWSYWANTIVPEVAQALYEGGLTYTAAVALFDDEYVSKWSETIYNLSGRFKYIENGGAQWLKWLQGSRTSHRHWWLSTSMNYYDAKWNCGDFRAARIALFADKQQHTAGTDIVKIKASGATYFKMTSADGGTPLGTAQASTNQTVEFDISTTAISAKDPSHIYGSKFVEELDVSCLAGSLNSINVAACYDDVLGTPLKKLNIGLSQSGTGNTRTGSISGTSCNIIGSSAGSGNALENLTHLNITGLTKLLTSLSVLAKKMPSLSYLYAAGTTPGEFENNLTGSYFEELELPAQTYLTDTNTTSTLSSITFNSADWNSLSFWRAEYSSQYMPVLDPETGDPITIDVDGVQQVVYQPNEATYKKMNIPAGLSVLKYTGSTASHPNAGKLLLQWIDEIENSNQSISSKYFDAENINWGAEENINDRVNIDYNTLAKIAQFNGGRNVQAHLKGYIRLSDSQQLTPVQLSLIKEWFGDGVFDISNSNAQLVIDQAFDYVQVSVGGGDVIINQSTGEISLAEEKVATLSANKFKLGRDTTEYTWHVYSDQNGATIYPRESEVLITDADDGIVRFAPKESADGVDYPLYIRASYQDNLGNIVNSDFVKINIIAVTYPEDFNFILPTYPVRKFEYTRDIASDIFGAEYASQTVLPDVYVLSYANLKYEFAIDRGSGYTARLKKIEYYLTDITGTYKTGYIDANNLNVGDSTINLMDLDDTLGFTKDSSKGGMTVQVINIPTRMKIYRLVARITIGGKAPFTRTIIIIVWNDNNPIVSYSGTDPLYIALSQKYMTDYNIERFDKHLYKTELLSLYGSLDMSGSGITSLMTENSDSVFTYMKYITSITLDGLTQITLNDLATGANLLDFSNILNLTSLSLNGCTGMNGSVLDLSGQPQVTSIDLRNTSLGIKLVNSKVNSLLLGSPLYISINNPETLTADNITIQSSQYLNNLILDNINQTSTYGYRTFDVIYNSL